MATKTKKKAVSKKAAPKTAKKASKARSGQKQTTQVMENIMLQGNPQYDKFAKDATKGSKEQSDAFMASGTMFMKGFEDIAKAYMGWAQSSADKNAQAAKSMLSCKTINEFTETQNKWAQENFDDLMAGATKLSELSVKVTTEAFEPINDQVNKGIKKATESVAA